MKNNYQFLRLAQVKDMTCLSKSSIYRLMEEGGFPRQVALGARSVVWVKSQVEYWMSKKIAIAQDSRP
jgi:prophage regulatory protein